MGASAALLSVLVGLGAVACITDPICGCSEAGSRVIVYGRAVHDSDGSPISGAQVSVAIGKSPASAGSPLLAPCQFDVVPDHPDNPAPVASDGNGRFRSEILSHPREPHCLQVTAILVSNGATLLGTVPIEVVFGLPGTRDSVRLEIALRAVAIAADRAEANLTSSPHRPGASLRIRRVPGQP